MECWRERGGLATESNISAAKISHSRDVAGVGYGRRVADLHGERGRCIGAVPHRLPVIAYGCHLFGAEFQPWSAGFAPLRRKAVRGVGPGFPVDRDLPIGGSRSAGGFRHAVLSGNGCSSIARNSVLAGLSLKTHQDCVDRVDAGSGHQPYKEIVSSWHQDFWPAATQCCRRCRYLPRWLPPVKPEACNPAGR